MAPSGPSSVSVNYWKYYDSDLSPRSSRSWIGRSRPITDASGYDSNLDKIRIQRLDEKEVQRKIYEDGSLYSVDRSNFYKGSTVSNQ